MNLRYNVPDPSSPLPIPPISPPQEHLLESDVHVPASLLFPVFWLTLFTLTGFDIALAQVQSSVVFSHRSSGIKHRRPTKLSRPSSTHPNTTPRPLLCPYLPDISSSSSSAAPGGVGVARRLATRSDIASSPSPSLSPIAYRLPPTAYPLAPPLSMRLSLTLSPHEALVPQHPTICSLTHVHSPGYFDPSTLPPALPTRVHLCAIDHHLLLPLLL